MQGVPSHVEEGMLSIVVPCFNEEANLPHLYDRIVEVLDKTNVKWELIAVDDHSADRTFDTAAQISARDPRVRAVRVARNIGSHLAAMCGLELSRGSAAIVMAADMEDPPEVIVQLLEQWHAGYQVVWAVRKQSRGARASDRIFSKVFHGMMARIVGRGHLTAQGADFFLIDRAVIDSLKRVHESNLSLFSMLAWIGFRQVAIEYEKQTRQHGTSGWSLRKKIKLVIDSVTAFSYAPIRFMSLAGVLVAVLGFLYAVFLILNRFVGGVPIEGWTSLMVVVLVLGGMQMVMFGVLGEYLWRTLDESRRRPRYDIERMTGAQGSLAAKPLMTEKREMLGSGK